MAWFRDGDLKQCKEYAFVTAKLQRMQRQLGPIAVAAANAHNLLYPLLSDNDDLVHWEAQYMPPLLHKSNPGIVCERPTNFEYLGLQPRLALQQEWDLLGERCERYLADPPKKRKLEAIDHKFFLALARQDRAGMEAALEKLLQPRALRGRNLPNIFPSEYKMFSAWHLMYLKIAHRLGVDIRLDTPWVPAEWQDVAPLASYPEPYDFLRDFNIFEPFPDRTLENGLNLRDLSPHPPGEPMLRYSDVKEMLGV